MRIFIGWFLALLITVTTAYYQRKTGPSYPKEIQTELNGQALKFKLPRTHDSDGNCEVRIPVNGNNVQGKIFFRRFPTNETWDTLAMSRTGNDLVASLPAQPPAGKLQYFVELTANSTVKRLDGQNAAIIRFKGPVPLWVLIPHILMMFLAMLFSNMAGLAAAFKVTRMRAYTIITVVLMVIGGFIFGPIMQKYAFGEFWTGVPFGWDLTDNKTLIAIVFWVLALLLNRNPRKLRPGWIIIAAVITLLIYSIPHSLFGSELNIATGTVTTG